MSVSKNSVRTTASGHAVVIGGSMAGLLAARVLADHYQRVTLIERDVFPGVGENRKGVPHGQHLHGFHPRGREILDELFPGFTDAMVAAGAVRCDVLADMRVQIWGSPLMQSPIGLPALWASRPFLEGHVREHVRALPEVTVLDGHSVAGLAASADRRRITGVEVDGPGGTSQFIEAGLVVDASGRGSRTGRWLTELGYEAPAEDRVEIGLGYSTRTYRLRPDALDGDVMILTAATPSSPRLGVLAATEGGRHMVTLGGICGDYPPTDPAEFDEFAASLLFPDISMGLKDAEPVGDTVTFRFPASRRKRYERLRDFPVGLIAIGDAVCSFNPVYGQGMTVAAMEAMTLRQVLATGGIEQPRRYFKAIARTIDIPWDIAVGADLAFPAVTGKRTAKVRMINAYLPRVCAAAEHDPDLAKALTLVFGLKARPQALMRPDRMVRVLRNRHGSAPGSGRKRGGGPNRQWS
jgi:2-polyprenyl-6-methoxyphenol hydroxylase-like FAD-dependent oxidoreductase